MARRTERRALPLKKGYRSPEVASYIAHLDDQTRLLLNDLKGVTGAELAWQPKRGHNTIGMLLAHLAVVEAYWVHFAKHEEYDLDALATVLGIGPDDDGMPLAENGKPPRALRGYTLAKYRTLLKRSRGYITPIAKKFTPAFLEKRIVRVRQNGSRAEMDVRWILYHVAEHFSGHYGQILLLRHQYRDRNKKK